MNQTKSSNRIVVIAGAAPAHGKPEDRQPPGRRLKARRIVVIRNGEWVGRRPRR